MKVLIMNNIVSLLTLFVLLLAPVTLVQAEGSKVKIGVVTCDYIPGTKVYLIIHSSASFNCVFHHGNVKNLYAGEAGISFGLDLLWTEQLTMSYAIMALTGKDIDWSTALNGTYRGGKISAAVGVGVGVAALIGGSRDGIGLVPLAIEGGTGFGATAGLGYLTLKNK